MIYKMTLKDSVDTMTFNLLETPIVDKDIEGAVDNVTLDGNQYTDYLYLKKQYIQKWAIMCPDEYDELRGFYTRQFEEGEVPSYRVYYGANVTRDYTFNGDYFQFNAEGIETGMILSQLLGNVEQTTYSGKNLFNFDKFISDNVSVQGVTRGTATYTSNSITLTATSNDCFTKYNFPTNLYPVITVSQNTDVTLSWKTNNTSGTNKGVVYVFGNNNGAATVIINAQDRAEHCTFNTGSYTEISFRVGVANSGDTLTYSDIQVEIGSAPTAYERFVGGIPAPNPDYPQPISTVTGENVVKIEGSDGSQEFEVNLGSIELCKIGNYQDRIYKTDGKWYIEKQVGKVVFDGSETWQRQVMTSGSNFYRQVGSNAKTNTDSLLNNQGVGRTFASADTNVPAGSCFISSSGNLNFLAPTYSSAADFQTHLSTTPMVLYYPLATPTTTEITDETLLSQLNFLASLYEGENNISLVGTGAQGEMEVFIRDVMSVETDVVPEVPVRLTLTDDGVINACGCRRNVQLTMRETTE